MALMGTAGPLLVLFLIVSPVSTQSTADPNTLCSLNLTATNNSTSYQITVSPETLSASTNYTVNITELSAENTVILRAQLQFDESGTWIQEGSFGCSKGIVFNVTNLTVSTWISPALVTSPVVLSAYIINGNETYFVSKTLSAALNTTTATTPANTTATITASTATTTTNMTASVTANSTASTIASTTANSTASTTASTTANSTASTTASTTANSNANSTASTTASTTANSTASTTASTTAKSDASTTANSTASTTANSIANSTASTTATKTASTASTSSSTTTKTTVSTTKSGSEKQQSSLIMALILAFGSLLIVRKL